MKFNLSLNLNTKLIGFFLVMAILPATVIGLTSLQTAQTSMRQQAFNTLEAVGTLKYEQINRYFGERIGDAIVLSEMPEIQNGVLTGNANDVFLTKYMQEYGYYDIFLFDNEGNCFYTVGKEADYGTNFLNGPYSSSGLGALYKQVRSTGNAEVADFAYYAPSGEAAAFVAAPVRSNGQIIGVVATQLSIQQINAIMQERSGMGESGETYLVGSDKLMRSDSRFSTETTILEQSISTKGVKDGLNGNTVIDIYDDYRGTSVLGWVKELAFDGFSWVVVAEIDESEAFASATSLQNLIIVIVGAAAAISAVAAYVIARSISNPINDVIDVLTTNVSTLSASAQQVSSGTEQTTGAIGQMATASQEQSSQIEGTSRIMSEMSATVQQAAANSSSAATTAQDANSAAIKGSEEAAKGSAVMKKIQSVVSESGEVIGELSEKSDEIGTIVLSISDIAQQTNLLALNAAIEAARAGEAGRGFAVVADEVKTLAVEAGEAAGKISVLVGDVQGSAAKVVTAMSQVTTDVEEGAQVVDSALGSLQEIASSVEDVSTKMQEISAGSQQQAASVQQVVDSIESVAAAAEENSASAEEVSAASEEQAASMQTIVAVVEEVDQMVNNLVTIVGARSDTVEE